MKLIVTGATGLVATEIIRQSLQRPEVTTLVAVARKPIQFGGNGSAKLKSVVVHDYDKYPDHVKAEFAGADACIWTVAVTPPKARGMKLGELKRVCQDFTMAGLAAILSAGPSGSFRFIYLSAEGTPTDPAHKPLLLGDYQLMRGQTEKMVLDFAAKHEGINACIARPGFVTTTTQGLGRAATTMVLGLTNLVTRAIPNIDRREFAAALLSLATKGFDKEVASNTDLLKLGCAELKDFPTR
ncbi:hypothetical protein F4778DRAFT_730824 [Xylariomycetidae sp. FL2044]|nr:hypothetical protein F4778DRAFT_730824 [Xylariomycetidae sp. FL2044]